MNDPRPGTPEAIPRRAPFIPLGIGMAVLGILTIGAVLLHRAEARTNDVALSSTPKLVSVIPAPAATYRASRVYVGTLEPWVSAAIGPQLVSAYVDTVLVRPGATVKKGDVLATLDCRNASAASQAVSMQARALDARQQALSHEAARVQGLLEGGFVSPNEAEQKAAQSAEQQAQLLSTRAKLLGSALEVKDCVLRAPFDGEIATRTIDPGAFVRPGTAIVTLVDRSVVRLRADAPERDFSVISPDTEVRIHTVSTARDMMGKIARRAPAADDATRTVEFEIDLANADRTIPVGTTAEIRIDVGEPVPAVRLPLLATTIRGARASVFAVENGVARKRTVPLLGEADGAVYLAPELAPGTLVVSQGRALLNDGDRVRASPDAAVTAPAQRLAR